MSVMTTTAPAARKQGPPRHQDGLVHGLLALALAATLPGPRSLQAQEIIDLPGRDEPLAADFEEVFRVGVVDGEPWEMFGNVRYAGFDASGNLYIVDGLSGGRISAGDTEDIMRSVRAMMTSMGQDRVLVFDASGRFVREFGSPGGGPGEFRMPTGFSVMRDGTMVVMDAGHRAYQLFDADGQFLRMVRGAGRWSTMLADPRGGGVFTGPISAGVGGANLVMSNVVVSGNETPSDPPASRSVLRLDLGGEEARVDTVVDGWLPTVGGEDAEVPNIEGIPASASEALMSAMGDLTPLIYEPKLLAGVLPDGGIVHSDSSAYALKVTPPGAGGVTRIVRRPLRPRPVTPAMKKEFQEKQKDARRGGAGSGGVIMRSTTVTFGELGSVAGQPASAIDFPEPRFYPEIPVLEALSTTWEGRVWVQRAADDGDGSGPIDVVTAEGRYVGTFASGATGMPDAFGPDGLAAFVEFDEFDVASVVVRRLPAAVR